MTAAEKEFEEKAIAPESAKTKKAREKLMKQLETEKILFTPKALKSTVEKIHKWIGDNSTNRVKVENKGIRLFNQNKDAARVSKKVQIIAETLKRELNQKTY
ncbi:MAG: hypothetical protein KGR16_05390 [Verrucomicrobia bacterium]|nr:hypothetical protein [Verrucomicrobiota bacterium]MDE3047796.1 hypothetical protein [Verrucomicrobiota bacterium]